MNRLAPTARALIAAFAFPFTPLPALGQAGGWTGTVTENAEFGFTVERQVTRRSVTGPFGKLGYEASSWLESRDLSGAHVLEVGVVNGAGMATISGNATWAATNDAAYRRDKCLRPLYWHDTVRARPVASREPPAVTIGIDPSGRYRISVSGSEIVRIERETHWRDVDPCATPARWDGDTSVSLLELPRNWRVDASGSTCDGNHLVGSTKTPWRKAGPKATGLPAWLTESVRKSGIAAGPGSQPGDVAWVRSEITWDLQRPGPKRSFPRCPK